MATNIDKFVEPSEIPGSVAVPVGGIIMWMNPTAAAMNPTPPGGFEYCDGTTVTTPGSPLFGEIKPNLMITSAGGARGVARGADVNAAPYGIGTALITGGNDNHSHSIQSSGTHSHSMQSHTHNLANHVHGAPAPNGGHDHGFTDTVNQIGVPTTGPTYQGGLFYHNHNTFVGPSAHSHGNSLAASPNVSDGPNTSNTDIQGSHAHTANNNTIIPVFHTEVAFIVRVL
jgi:hypothetical protein